MRGPRGLVGYCLRVLLLTGCGWPAAAGPGFGVATGTRMLSTATRVTGLSSAGTPAALVSPTRDATDWGTFADRLRGAGFAVERTAEASEPFLRTRGARLLLTGGALVRPARLAVYTYDDPALAADDATRVQPDTGIRWVESDGHVRTIAYTWVAPPHFFLQGRMPWPFTLSAVRCWHSHSPTARKLAWME